MKHWLALAALLSSLHGNAAELAGVTLPNSTVVEGRTLALNGIGLREYGFMKIDVYVAALYTASPQRSAAAILGSAEPKAIEMKMLRGGSAADTVKVWDHYFAANCTAPCMLPTAEIAAFKKLVPETVAGDVQRYVFLPAAIEFFNNGKRLGRVEGAGFSRLLLSTWIGTAPPTVELRKALLGGK